MANKNKYNEILEEMLELADVPLNEQDDEEEPEEPETDDEEKGKDKDKEDEPEDELHDEWEKQIKTGSLLRIQFHTNYIYVWYRNKKSNRIMIPQKLRPHKNLVSGLFEKILAHVENTS